MVGMEVGKDDRPTEVGVEAPSGKILGVVTTGCCRGRGWMELSDPEDDMSWYRRG